MNKAIRIVLFSILAISVAIPLSLKVTYCIGMNDNDAALAYSITLYFSVFTIVSAYPWGNKFKWKELFVRMLIVLLFSSSIFGLVWAYNATINEPFSHTIEKGKVKKAKRILDQSKEQIFFPEDSANFILSTEKFINHAIAHNSWEMVDLLLKYNVDINNFKYADLCPLAFAIRIGSTEAYEKLVEMGANPKENSGQQLFEALAPNNSNNTKILQFILEKGVNPNVSLITNQGQDFPPLHWLINKINLHNYEKRYWEAIRILISNGANINYIDQLGHTPIMYTSNNANKQQLVKLGAIPIEVDFKEETKLHKAIWDLNDVKDILNEKPLLLEIGNKTGARPLYYACENSQYSKNNNLKIIKTLIEFGANPNASTNYGYTPILALNYKNDITDILQILVKAGANINIKANNETPLLLAVDNNNKKVIEFLLQQGANISPNLSDFAKTHHTSNDIAKLIYNYIQNSKKA